MSMHLVDAQHAPDALSSARALRDNPPMNLPALASSQISAIHSAMREHSACPVPVFQGDAINEVAAFKHGQWLSSVAANPDGPGLIAMDETGKVLAYCQDPRQAVRHALFAADSSGTEALSVRRRKQRKDGVQASRR